MEEASQSKYFTRHERVSPHAPLYPSSEEFFHLVTQLQRRVAELEAKADLFRCKICDRSHLQCACNDNVQKDIGVCGGCNKCVSFPHTCAK